MSSTRPRVVATGNLSTFPAQAFEDRVDLCRAQTDEELRAALREAEILYSWSVPDSVPAEAPGLRWVHLPSAGADHLRRLPVWRSSVQLSASQGIHTVPMSEHLFAMLLALTRNVATMVRAQERREWLHDTRTENLRFGELRGKTVGLIGWGKIGDGIAHLARGFGMRVVGTRWSVVVPRSVPPDGLSPYADPPWLEPVRMPSDVVYPAAQLHEVLAQSDVLVILLPLTDDTRGAIGHDEVRSMKRGALLFNLGRGPVVDEGALVEGLRSGRIGGAGLDVFAHEPLPRSSPLWAMPNVIISPHVGGVSENTRERANRLFAVNLTRYLEGQELLNVVDRTSGY